MTGIGVQPLDGAQVPTSSQYSPQNNSFTMMQGADGAYVDQFGNQSSAPVMSFIQPRVAQRAIAQTGSGAKSLSCSFPNANIGGNSIVVCVGIGDMEDAFTSFAVTDLQGNTYTEVTRATQGTLLESAIFFASGIKPGQNTITFTAIGPQVVNTAIAMKIYEVWGLIASIDAVDQTDAGNSINPSNQASTFASLTPASPNEIAFTAVAAGKITTITPGSGWSTNDGTIFPWGGNLGSFDSQYRQLSTITTINPKANLSLASPWVMSSASFRTIVLPIQGTVNIAPSVFAQINVWQSSTSSVQILGYNNARKGLSIVNSSAFTLYIAYGSPATTSSYSVPIQGIQVVNGQSFTSFYEMPVPLFLGPVYLVWAGKDGNAKVTEFS
jgi:hypothetical protein